MSIQFAWHYGRMNETEVVIGLGLLCLLFIVQPALIGVHAQRTYHRAGACLGILAFVLDVGILVFFETHRPSGLIFDFVAEAGTVVSLSAISVLAALEVLRNGPPARAEGTLRINFRRGVFRIWLLISGSWIAFCVIKFRDCPYWRHGDYSPFDNYLGVGEWFVGIPALTFITGLAVCWVFDGFGRSPPHSSGDPAHEGAIMAAEPPGPVEAMNPASAVGNRN
jgi:hypothetical protein